ncbi:helix-turn-helix domain-containing protein [Glutamicibacter sp. MCAF14]|uniref:helix-turn-helix domain-containing protein n=1 Tax=Glutamicibacter sp. MCAF14 TaxID=3233043 RepID=UPI003F9116A9
MSSTENESVADIVRAIQEEKSLSQREIAEELRRNPRMVSKILRGETSGEWYREALTELRDRGEVTKHPGRRRSKSGNIVPVRAKVDEKHPLTKDDKGRIKAPVAVPEETAEGRWTKKPPKRFSNRRAYGSGGDRHYSTTMHPTNADSRSRGISAIHDNVRSVAKSQKNVDKRISLNVTLSNGRMVEVGSKSGYFSSDILRTVKEKFGGDMHKFLIDQIGKTYAADDFEKSKITGVDMTVFDAKRTPARSRKRR